MRQIGASNWKHAEPTILLSFTKENLELCTYTSITFFFDSPPKETKQGEDSYMAKEIVQLHHR